MTSAYETMQHRYDVVIVEAVGAGLRAAPGMASAGLKTARVTKTVSVLTLIFQCPALIPTFYEFRSRDTGA